ncbi:MAG: O-antigen ligase family protein [Elusimicrobia bacterium]|nr:O-antigen ligase family protein [Elusimicrobiota bacterium]
MWVLIGLLVAIGPLLRGAWDLWAQTLLLIAVIAGSSLWLAAGIVSGRVPALRGRVLLWAGALAGLGAVCAAASPLAATSVPEWRWRLAGLWVFAVLPAVSEDERDRIDIAIRAAAWALVLLVFWQKFVEGQGRPPGSLLKENVFAGTCLLFLPLAWKARDYFLLAALLLAMVWSRSVGAWLALAAAGAALGARPAARRLGLVAAAVCAAVVLAKFRDAAVLDRLRWWGAAWGMFLDRPWTGYGPGAFAYVLPAFSPGAEVSSLYAHQSVIESLAETGWLHTLLLFAGFGVFLRAGRTHRTFGAAAVLVQSMWDLTLSIPANLWLFSYYAGSSLRPASRWVAVPRDWRLPSVLLVLGLGGILSQRVWSTWQADRLRTMASARLSEARVPGDIDGARRLLERSAALVDHAETRRLLAETELGSGGTAWAEGPGAEGMAAAAGHLERAAELNPYRPSTWAALEVVYRGLGREDAARDARSRGVAFCAKLK